MISESAKKFLDLLFRDGEEVCVSPDKYGYHSLPLDQLGYETLEIVLPNQSSKMINTNEIKLIALNPIKGWRNDESCTSFRNFLVEMDFGSNADQLRYAWDMALPYSAAVFSGGKSIHFAICLDQGISNYYMYVYLSTWILNIMEKADQQTKNPSRGIRFPGNLRDGKEQKLIQIRGLITLDDLNAWLSKHPDKRPTDLSIDEKHEKYRNLPTDDVEKAERLRDLSPWVIPYLKSGIDKKGGRNVEWYKIASELGKAGFSEEEAVRFAEQYFTPEYDFKRREWLMAMKSGVQNGQKQSGYI